MRKTILFLFLVFSCLNTYAQSVVADTLLFRECFRDSILNTDVELMRKVYNNLLGGPKVSMEVWMDVGGSPPVYTVMDGNGNIIKEEQGYHVPFTISPTLKKSNIDPYWRRKLFQTFKAQHPRGWNIDEAKAAMVRRLQRFDSLSVHKPLFFSTIYADYGGDIVKYVDALYDTAIMAKKKNLRTFIRKPTPFAIQNDLGYQFSLGLALYEGWIEQVRNGEVEE